MPFVHGLEQAGPFQVRGDDGCDVAADLLLFRALAEEIGHRNRQRLKMAPGDIYLQLGSRRAGQRHYRRNSQQHADQLV